jgi:programmed cell death 8 (apoptosis-inducing factor)
LIVDFKHSPKLQKTEETPIDTSNTVIKPIPTETIQSLESMEPQSEEKIITVDFLPPPEPEEPVKQTMEFAKPLPPPEIRMIENQEIIPKSTMPSLTPVKYVLVGAGTASFGAVEAIKEKDPNADILIIGNENHPNYSRTPLSKELWSSQSNEPLHYIDWRGKESR